MVTESEELGTHDLEVNTELRPSASHEWSWLWYHLKRVKGWKGEHMPETDLTRSHHVLEEGDKFES